MFEAVLIPDTHLDKVQRVRELKESVFFFFYPYIHPYQQWQQVNQVSCSAWGILRHPRARWDV